MDAEQKETVGQRNARLKLQLLGELRTNPNVTRAELAAKLGLKENYSFGVVFTAARDQLRVEDGIDIKPIPGTGTYAVATPEQSHKRARNDVSAAKKKLTRSKQKAELGTLSSDPKVSASAKRLVEKVEYLTSRAASAVPKENPFEILNSNKPRKTRRKARMA